MGRIAEALKRAEQERRRSFGNAQWEEGSPAVPPGPKQIVTDAQALTPPDSGEGNTEAPISVVQGVSESLVPFFERTSLITEQYRSLRTRLLSQNPNYEHRVIAITSAVPKEGKSVTSLNLGAILAEIRHLKVLVVDGDFRRSSLASMLNQVESPGLAEVLSGNAKYSEVIRSTPIPNLKFLAAGNTNEQSAAELLTAAATWPAFKRMQNDFHYTIVDTPPATTVTDVGILGQMCTGVIMVVRLHRTDETAAKRAVRLLQVNNIPIMGCLLVGRDAPVGGYGYRYGQAYKYYRYYDDYKKSDGDR